MKVELREKERETSVIAAAMVGHRRDKAENGRGRLLWLWRKGRGEHGNERENGS